MRASLHEHLVFLEQCIQTARDRLTGTLTAEESARLREQLTIAERSLTYYRKAYELEQQLPKP